MKRNTEINISLQRPSVASYCYRCSSLPILVNLIMEVMRSSEISVVIRATRHHIPESGILHSHCRENVTSYIALTGWTL
jgi:hypothetical protein